MPWLAHYKFSAGVPAGLNHLNTLRFGTPDTPQMFGMCDARVSRHAFLPGVNYARSVVRYPESFSKPSPGLPNVAAPQPGLPGTPGEFTWTRQMLMLTADQPTGPQYLVIRDSVAGNGKLPSWWHLWAAGTKDDVRQAGHTVTYRQPYNVTLDVHVLQPRGTKIELIPHINAVNANDKMVLTRLTAPAGEGYLTVLFPYKDGEKSATVSSPREGVVKVVHEAGTDYIFITPERVSYDVDGLLFEGGSGMVRIGKDAVTLIMAEGPGRVGYRNIILVGPGPYRQTLPLTSFQPDLPLTALPSDIRPMTAATVSFPLPAANGAAVQPGVTKDVDGATTRYRFDNAAGSYRDAQVAFSGEAGIIEITGDTRRFLLATGTGRLQAGDSYIDGEGPFDLTMTREVVTGTVDGPTRVFVMSVPPGIVGIPDLFIDGVRWSPGNWDRAGCGWYAGLDVPRQMAIAVPAGKHTIAVKRFIYPPVWTENPMR
jgi:hypothetical protein